jgi:hypothetical protein
METYFYIAALLTGIFAVPFIWIILGAPRVRVPKVWRPSAEVDELMSGDKVTKAILAAHLDECERAIS